MNIFSTGETGPQKLTSHEVPFVLDVIDFTAKAVNNLIGIEGRRPAQIAIENTPAARTATEIIDALVGMPNENAVPQNFPGKPSADVNEALDLEAIRSSVAASFAPSGQAAAKAQVIQFPVRPEEPSDVAQAS